MLFDEVNISMLLLSTVVESISSLSTLRIHRRRKISIDEE